MSAGNIAAALARAHGGVGVSSLESPSAESRARVVPAEPPSSNDPIVLGGGLAGASLAVLLARSGHPVTLVEQHAEARHKVCGDFLSAEGVTYLRALGLDPLEFGAVPIHILRLAVGNRLIETDLPFRALSLSRFVLDEELLKLAAGYGARLLRGSRAETLTRPSDDATLRPTWSTHASYIPSTVLPHWQLRLASGHILSSPAVFLATGKHDLRGHPRPAGKHSTLVAFKSYLRLDPRQAAALGQAIELTLFPHGYAGLQPVEPDELGPRANLCLLVERDHLRALGGTWPALLGYLLHVSPHLRRRVYSAEQLLAQPLAISHIPYGLLASGPPAAGLWPLGDQAAVIPSLTGDGMSIALHTAHLAAAAYLERRPPLDYIDALQGTLRRQIRLATLASRLAVRPALQPALGLTARLRPSLLQTLARATRIPKLSFTFSTAARRSR